MFLLLFCSIRRINQSSLVFVLVCWQVLVFHIFKEKEFSLVAAFTYKTMFQTISCNHIKTAANIVSWRYRFYVLNTKFDRLL